MITISAPLTEAKTLRKFGLIIAGALLLQGCTLLGTAYNNAGRLITWQVDGYLDLNRAQKQDLRERLAGHLEWHRREELLLYAALLQHVQDQVDNGVTAAGWRTTVQYYQARRDHLLDRISRDVAVLLASLEPDQVEHLRRKMAAENRDLEDMLQEPAQVRHDARVQNLAEWLESWYGPLTAQQFAAVDEIYARTSGTRDPTLHRLERRRQSQQSLLALLEQRPTATEIETWLAQWRASWQAPANREWRQRLEARILAIDAILTPHQRQQAAARLQRYIDIINDLALPRHSSTGNAMRQAPRPFIPSQRPADS